MGSLKSGLFAIALTSLVGTAAVVGCSADGGSAITDTDPTEPAPADDGAGRLPPSSSSGNPAPVDAGGKDASKKDSGPKPEAGVDAGPPPPVEGAVCPTANVIAKKSCGVCGTAETVCLDDGVAKKWSPYGQCGSELAGGCTPGSTQACGNCGTQTCSQFCAWGACNGQPANSCAPGGVDLVGAGCPTNTFRQRTCKPDCSYTNFSLTCDPPPTFLSVAPAVGGQTSAIISLGSAQTAKRVTGTCPAATLSTTTTAYNYFEVRNPTTKVAKVTIFHSQAPGGPIPDTIIAAYNGTTEPVSDAERAACVKGVGDFGAAALTGDANFAALTGTSQVAIPAGGSVLVYSANYYPFTAGDPDAALGNIKLNVKTDALE